MRSRSVYVARIDQLDMDIDVLMEALAIETNHIVAQSLADEIEGLILDMQTAEFILCECDIQSAINLYEEQNHGK